MVASYPTRFSIAVGSGPIPPWYYNASPGGGSESKMLSPLLRDFLRSVLVLVRLSFGEEPGSGSSLGSMATRGQEPTCRGLTNERTRDMRPPIFLLKGRIHVC